MNDLLSLLALLGLFLAWILAPLIPAVLTYVVAPRDRVVVTGPLEGLSIKASGAFAAYLIIFVCTSIFVYKAFEQIRTLSKPYWELEATIRTFDLSGNEIELGEELRNIRIGFSPERDAVGDNFVKVRFFRSGAEFPKVTFEIPKFGAQTINLQDYARDASETDKLIKLPHPITIQQRKPLPPPQ